MVFLMAQEHPTVRARLMAQARLMALLTALAAPGLPLVQAQVVPGLPSVRARAHLSVQVARVAWMAPARPLVQVARVARPLVRVQVARPLVQARVARPLVQARVARPSVQVQVARAARAQSSVRAQVARPAARVLPSVLVFLAARTDRGRAVRPTTPRLRAARWVRAAAHSARVMVRWYPFGPGAAPQPATQRRAVPPPQATPMPRARNTWQARTNDATTIVACGLSFRSTRGWRHHWVATSAQRSVRHTLNAATATCACI